MCPPLQQPPPFTHDKNGIRILYRRQPMRNRHHRPPPRRAPKRRLDEPLALRVERAGGLVEEQNPGVADERAGNGDALLLAARKGDAAGANVGVVAVGEGCDEVVDRGGAACGVELPVWDGAGVEAEEDVVSDGAWGS